MGAGCVMFITMEDETEIADPFVWPQVFEANRRTVLIASMLGVEGYVQREGEVVHIAVRKPTDLSGMLASLSERGAPFPLRMAAAMKSITGVRPISAAASSARSRRCICRRSRRRVTSAFPASA